MGQMVFSGASYTLHLVPPPGFGMVATKFVPQPVITGPMVGTLKNQASNVVKIENNGKTALVDADVKLGFLTTFSDVATLAYTFVPAKPPVPPGAPTPGQMVLTSVRFAGSSKTQKAKTAMGQRFLGTGATGFLDLVAEYIALPPATVTPPTGTPFVDPLAGGREICIRVTGQPQSDCM